MEKFHKIEENFDTQSKMFIAECEAVITRFTKSIKRSPLQNISQDYIKKNKN